MTYHPHNKIISYILDLFFYVDLKGLACHNLRLKVKKNNTE